MASLIRSVILFCPRRLGVCKLFPEFCAHVAWLHAVSSVAACFCLVQFCLWQAAALVHIYKDGSVLVSHGGTEMGQGVHTKMQQVLCEAPHWKQQKNVYITKYHVFV